MLVKAVFREPHGHREDGACREAGESLQQPLRDGVGVLLHFAARVDHESRPAFAGNNR